ncbi:MAG: arginine--tRNA ligase [Nanoarchaeota archaeon]
MKLMVVNALAELRDLSTLSKEKLTDLVEIPKDSKLGDYAFPCFPLASKLKKSPVQIAQELAKAISKDCFDKVESSGPYVNFFISKSILVKQAIKNASKANFGKGKERGKILIDYSGPNVAKHFGIHNLRSTLIGHALYNILKFSGYKVRSINHLGDWGTQFGKLIVSYNMFGKKSKIEDIESLNKLYVKFHDCAEKDPKLEEKARLEFKKLESEDKENLRLWKLFLKISLKEFNKTYKILGIKFDQTKGESFYRDKIDNVFELLKKNKLVEESEGAMVVKLSGEKPPLIVKKSDEASTYATRDLATIFERLKEKPSKILYVVDVAQSLHFEQVFEVVGKLGIDTDKLVHVKFGRLKFPDSQMSTRKGNVILFEELLSKAKEEIIKIIKDKNPELKDKDKVAEHVALSAIIFHDLRNFRTHDIIFDWSSALSFEGRSGPYILYTYARASSILKKSNSKKGNSEFEDIHEKEFQLAKKINEFPEMISKSARDYSPSTLSEYSYELAQMFNEFYHACPVIGDKNEGRRIALLQAFCKILATSLDLLGIAPVKEM